MKAWLLFSFLVLAAGLKAQTPAPETPAVNLSVSPTATAEEALAKVYSSTKAATTQTGKEPTAAEKAEAIRRELVQLRLQNEQLEFFFERSKQATRSWKEATEDWEKTALHNKEVAEKSMASSEANYNAAIEAREIAEKWKEIALHNQRVAQENARIAQDNADAATAASYQQPASKKTSPFIHVINTAEGHWMTTDGTQIIKTGAGQATIIRP